MKRIECNQNQIKPSMRKVKLSYLTLIFFRSGVTMVSKIFRIWPTALLEKKQPWQERMPTFILLDPGEQKEIQFLLYSSNDEVMLSKLVVFVSKTMQYGMHTWKMDEKC